MRSVSVLLLIAAAWACSLRERIPATEIISLDDERIRITGRVKRGTDSVTIYWPGTSILVRFSGKELKAHLNDERGENYFNIVIDGDSLRYIRLDSSKHTYVIASGLPPGEHTIELIKRTEWDRGKTWFYGMETDGAFHELPPKNERVIEFYGNSITAGYAIEDYSGNDSWDSIYTNNYFTYAAITARHFKADYYCTVKSGIGILVSWFNLTMPEMYGRLDPTDSLSKWDFRQVKPDIVVINLFQNDSWLVNMPDHPSFKQRFGVKPPQPDEIIRAYRDFVQTIRREYPDSEIICALGSMDATRGGSPWPGYVQKAVEELKDPKIYTFFFPYTAKEGHPRKEDNRIMAESLIRFIDNNVQW